VRISMFTERLPRGTPSAAPSAPCRARDTGLDPSRPGSGTCDDAFRPYRHLAIRVLMSALRDAASVTGSKANRDSARVFFANSRMLSHWCRVAALDPDSIADRVTVLFGTASGLRQR